MSWWDYGYQIGTMANRTTIIDNFTMNNTHIAKVGKIFAGTEEESYQHLVDLDADYVLGTIRRNFENSNFDLNFDFAIRFLDEILIFVQKFIFHQY